MSHSPMTRVQIALGGRSPAYLKDLSEEELLALEQAIVKAKAHEKSALSEAIQDALLVVPALVRRPIKNMLFPKRN